MASFTWAVHVEGLDWLLWWSLVCILRMTWNVDVTCVLLTYEQIIRHSNYVWNETNKMEKFVDVRINACNRCILVECSCYFLFDLVSIGGLIITTISSPLPLYKHTFRLLYTYDYGKNFISRLAFISKFLFYCIFLRSFTFVAVLVRLSNNPVCGHAISHLSFISCAYITTFCCKHWHRSTFTMSPCSIDEYVSCETFTLSEIMCVPTIK